MNPDVDAMKAQRLLWSDAVQKNTTIITPDDMGQDYLLHIAMDKQKEFIPYHSRNPGEGEDNTISRVYVAPDVVGCLFGFPFTENLLTAMSVDDIPNNYKGGVYIHKIPFRAALQPESVLTPTQYITREKWLVTYNQDTRKYPAEIVGKIVFNKAILMPVHNAIPKRIFEFYIESLDKIKISPKRFVDKGYWKLLVVFHSAEDHDSFSLEPLSTAEWNKSKKDKAALLSSKTNIGAILNKWKK